MVKLIKYVYGVKFPADSKVVATVVSRKTLPNGNVAVLLKLSDGRSPPKFKLIEEKKIKYPSKYVRVDYVYTIRIFKSATKYSASQEYTYPGKKGSIGLKLNVRNVTESVVIPFVEEHLKAHDIDSKDTITHELDYIENVDIISEDDLRRGQESPFVQNLYVFEWERLFGATETTGKILEFDWIPEAIDIKINQNRQCGYNMLKALKKSPAIFKNEEEILKLFNKYWNEEQSVRGIPQEKREILTLESGVTPMLLHKLCQEFDVSHYALDINKNVILKYISKKQNYSPVFYIAHSNHIYFINEPSITQKYYQSRQNSKTSTTVKVKKSNTEEEKEIKEIKEDIIYENLEVSKLKTLKNAVVIYDQKCIRNIFEEIFALENKIYEQCTRNNVMYKIYYKNNVVLMNDPNAELYFNGLDGKKINYKTVIELCKLFNIPFNNQSYPAVVRKVAFDCFEKKIKRKQRTLEEKLKIVENQNKKCSICNCDLDKSFHIDHIIPLAANGTDEDENLQALCIPCHFDKTKNEFDSGAFVPIPKYSSTFNNEVRKITESDLFKRYAFIERVKKVQKNKKLFYIDINKTRRNILKFLKQSNIRIPVFTCMDNVQSIQDDEIISKDSLPGFYYIDSDNYIPLRKKGWYSLEMVLYCLSMGYIKQNNILYKIEASLSIDGDYFNEAIELLMTFPNGLDKSAVNILIGMFNQGNTTFTKSHYTTSFKQASNMVLSRNSNDIFIQRINKENVYEIQTTKTLETEYYNNIIYHLILDIEAIEIDKLRLIVESNNGTVTYYNTDCVECYFKNNNPVDITQYFWDDEKTLPKYKFEIKSDIIEEIIVNKNSINNPVINIEEEKNRITNEYSEKIELAKKSTPIDLRSYYDLNNVSVYKQLYDEYCKHQKCNGKAYVSYDKFINNSKINQVAVDKIKDDYFDYVHIFEDEKQFKIKFLLDDLHSDLESIDNFKPITMKVKKNVKLIERMKQHVSSENYSRDNINEWTIYEDPQNNDFEPLVKQLYDNNKGFLNMGIAGAGKTTFLRQFINTLNVNGKKYYLLATTNKAAVELDLNTFTIHKFIMKFCQSQFDIQKYLSNIDYLILDEVSMLEEKFYYKLSLIKKYVPKIKVILSGDFQQIEPVNDRKRYDYISSDILFELCDGNQTNFTKCRRSDEKLFEFSKSLNLSKFNVGKEEHDLCICYTNKKRIELNDKWINHYAPKFAPKIKKYEKDERSQDYKLYKNLPLIGRMNAVDNKDLENPIRIVNNLEYNVTSINFKSKTFDVFDKKTQDIQTIKFDDCSKYFRPGYAITDHASQGSTYDRPVSIYQWHLFTRKMQYTAVTRVKLFEQLNIIL